MLLRFATKPRQFCFSHSDTKPNKKRCVLQQTKEMLFFAFWFNKFLVRVSGSRFDAARQFLHGNVCFFSLVFQISSDFISVNKKEKIFLEKEKEKEERRGKKGKKEKTFAEKQECHLGTFGGM